MATKIVRQTQSQFGGSLAASGNIAVFGSQAAGAPAYSLTPTVIQSLAQYLQGWSAAVFGNNAPAKQDRNALDYLFSYQLGYILQAGMPEWDALTPYFASASFCQVAGVIYLANTSNTGINPVTDVNSSGIGTNWSTYAAVLSSVITPPNPQALARAWVYYSGTTGQVFASFNVSSVTVLATGEFQINFTTPMSDANYLVLQSTSNDSSAPYDPFTRLNGDVKTVSAVVVRNLNGNTLAGWGNNAENYVAIYR